MAISEEETKLRDETRTALLKAIKQSAETATNNAERHRTVVGDHLHNLAQAYVLVIGTAKPPEPPAELGGFA